MSVTRRRAKAARRLAEAETAQNSRLRLLLDEAHLAKHPHCTYGRVAHFVPPSLGDPGFYMCDLLDHGVPTCPAGA